MRLAKPITSFGTRSGSTDQSNLYSVKDPVTHQHIGTREG